MHHTRSRRETLLGWGLLVYTWRKLCPGSPFPKLVFSPSGKPRFADGVLRFNLSHTTSLICLAVSDAGDVGVDVQSLEAPSDALSRKVLTPGEQAALSAARDRALCFTRFWTQKEAFVKLTGEGIARGFATLDFAPFSGQASFSAFGARFLTEERGDAVVTLCAAEEGTVSKQDVTQKEMENVLFFCADS